MSHVGASGTLAQRPRFTRGQVLGFSVAAFLVAFGAVPRAMGRRGPRLGWSGGRPGPLNRMGTVPLALGAAGWAWCLAHHYEPGGTVPVSLVPESLIGSGPYRISRNPMYLSEGAILLGWTLYYGSPKLLARTATFAAGVRYAVGREERTLQARFGDAWQEYAAKVPRWV